MVRFLAEPKFEEETNDVVGLLTLSSNLVTYRAILSPQKSADIVGQYHTFCDVYAKLNSILTPGALPPAGRIMLDAALARHQATASSVTLTILSDVGAKPRKTSARSEHRLVCPPEASDLERIAKIDEQMESFKLVTFEEYRKSTQR